MLTEAERVAILGYVRTLRAFALDDKIQAARTRSPRRRAHLLSERRRRILEALRWRRHEREYRASTIKALLHELVRSQLQESVMMEAAE